MTQTISALAIDAVNNYQRVGKNLVDAYRTGSERAIARLDERYTATLNKGNTPLLSDNVKQSLIDAQRQVSTLWTAGIVNASNRANAAIDKAVERVAESIKRGAEVATRVEAAIGNGTVDVARRLNMPAAQITRDIAARLADSSEQLAARVAGDVVADEGTIVVDEVLPASGQSTSRRVRKLAA